MNILNKFTLKTLLKNKTRSIVTIIGIVLSLAMFTAVTTSVYSMQQFMSEAAKEKEGDWHGAFKGMSRDELAELSDNEQVDSLVFLQDIGYAKLEKGQNEYKPYIFIGGINENFDEKMPVNLISGHLPQSPTEIILPKHIATNGGVKYALGDTLNLKIGRRFFDGKIMLQNNEFVKGKVGDEAETLKLDKSRSYTVVGFYERPTFEGHSAPGYTALTLSEEDPELSSTAYYKLKNMNNINKFAEENYTYLHQELNTDFLSFSGISQYSAFKEVLYSFAGILMIIIAFGSISLIYNSFSISVSERTRQFGLLSSVGATRRQMRQSVLFEAVVLGAVGIPLGLVTGMAGMAITFRLTGSMFTAMSSGQTDKTMDMCVSWQSLAIAAVVGFITVIISAYIPARRAVKLSAIEAVKQTGDISIKAKKVKTSRLTYTLFGFEGMLASKNFKRNRKKYRATVISLFMSVVLFISAMGYCTYLTRGTENVFSKSEYDISYRVPDIKKEALDWKEFFRELSDINGVKESSYTCGDDYNIIIDKSEISGDFLEYIKKNAGEDATVSEDITDLYAKIKFIDDEYYKDYLKKNSLDENVYMDNKNPTALAFDFIKIFDGEKYFTFNVLKDKTADISFLKKRSIEGDEEYNAETADGVATYSYRNSKGEQCIAFSKEEAIEKLPLKIGDTPKNKPFCIDDNEYGITLTYPYSAMEAVMGEKIEYRPTFLFAVQNHKTVFDNMIALAEEKGREISTFIDYAETVEANRALVNIINVFSYGFIILISLISVANVFNTISTNIALRRREFAMLKSIGLTKRGFNKMMNYECLLYGLKGLIYGIPVALIINFYIYRGMTNGVSTQFIIPWTGIAISIASVFIVVFLTMLYSMSKIKKDNPIDALKNENL